MTDLAQHLASTWNFVGRSVTSSLRRTGTATVQIISTSKESSSYGQGGARVVAGAGRCRWGASCRPTG